MGTKAGDFNQFFGEIEDLLKRLADFDGPDIQKIRAKVRDALQTAKSAAKDGANQARRQARDAADSADELVRAYPWPTVGVAVLLGVGLGVVLASMRRE